MRPHFPRVIFDMSGHIHVKTQNQQKIFLKILVKGEAEYILLFSTPSNSTKIKQANKQNNQTEGNDLQ